jgi:hypothetical protein
MVKKAKQWFSLNLISAPQMAAVLKKYPVEYFKPNVFIKIGLFIFTFFIIGAAMSVISLFTFMVFSQLESFEGYGIFMSILFGGVAGFLLPHHRRVYAPLTPRFLFSQYFECRLLSFYQR